MRATQKTISALLAIALLTVVVAAFAIAADDPIVSFNTSSLKYHCPSCEWAIKCTKNCINIKRSEAIKRGGVPCKICGGCCR